MKKNSFISELIDLFKEPEQKMTLIRFLSRYEGKTLYFPKDSKKERRARAAKNMLIRGMDNQSIIDALMQRFNICDKTARRDIREADNITL